MTVNWIWNWSSVDTWVIELYWYTILESNKSNQLLLTWLSIRPHRSRRPWRSSLSSSYKSQTCNPFPNLIIHYNHQNVGKQLNKEELWPEKVERDIPPIQAQIRGDELNLEVRVISTMVSRSSIVLFNCHETVMNLEKFGQVVDDSKDYGCG